MCLPLFPLILLAVGLDRLDLEGRVVTDSGQGVAGAHVLIDSARVRKGTSPICPSCYLDCRKSAETDGDGKFRIASVDPELLFNVLVVADGYRPTFAPRSDPALPPITVKLAPFDPAKFDPRCVLKGVVLDPDGQPIVGAKLTPNMFRTDDYSGFSPGIFDPVGVSNLRGEFVLTSRSPIESADLRVEANGAAPRIVPGLRPEKNPQTIKLSRGATLTGRIVRNGQPLAGVTVGLVQKSKSSQSYLGDFLIGTDADGRFAFLNVHADEDYVVYGIMGSLPDGGAVPATEVHVEADGSTRAVGDLAVVAGHCVRGRILLADGKTIPPATRLMIGREDAWDFQTIKVDPEGRFEVLGLPTERYHLNIQLPGYKLSLKNHSVDPQNPGQFVGTIDQDIDSLKILLEPEAGK